MLPPPGEAILVPLIVPERPGLEKYGVYKRRYTVRKAMSGFHNALDPKIKKQGVRIEDVLFEFFAENLISQGYVY